MEYFNLQIVLRLFGKTIRTTTTNKSNWLSCVPQRCHIVSNSSYREYYDAGLW